MTKPASISAGTRESCPGGGTSSIPATPNNNALRVLISGCCEIAIFRRALRKLCRPSSIAKPPTRDTARCDCAAFGEVMVDKANDFSLSPPSYSSAACLCGTMFPELRVLRHRLFEANFAILAPPHKKHPKVHTFDRRKSHFGKTDEWKDFVQVTGGGNCTLAAAREAMGIDWMTKGEINESIPPAYTEFIGRELLRYICFVRGRKSA